MFDGLASPLFSENAMSKNNFKTIYLALVFVAIASGAAAYYASSQGHIADQMASLICSALLVLVTLCAYVFGNLTGELVFSEPTNKSEMPKLFHASQISVFVMFLVALFITISDLLKII